MLTKVCSKCGIEKNLSEYYKEKRGLLGVFSRCKDCIKLYRDKTKNKRKLYDHEYRKKNKDKKKQYIEKNKDKLKLQSLEYYYQNIEKIKKYRNKNKDKYKAWRKKNKAKIEKYREENKERLKLNRKIYYIKNYDKIKIKKKIYNNRHKKQASEYQLFKYRNNPSFKIAHLLRSRIRLVLKKDFLKKNINTEKLIGCTFDYLRSYIEKQFLKNMTWEKFLNGEIHIDHIIPCSKYDLIKKEEQFKCFNYRNLRPCWGIENIKKSDNLDLDLIKKYNILDLLPEQIQMEGLRYEA